MHRSGTLILRRMISYQVCYQIVCMIIIKKAQENELNETIVKHFLETKNIPFISKMLYESSNNRLELFSYNVRR